jgi:CAAX prenyl protease-like protein
MAISVRPESWARVLPFVVFMVFLAARGAWPPGEAWAIDGTWIYAFAVVAVSALLIWFRRCYTELSRSRAPTARELLLATAVGVIVFWLWIFLDQPWMTLGEPSASFRPVRADGTLQWGAIAIRWVGAALMVPVMEELFWRSFLMRWIQNPQFESQDPRQLGVKAIVLSTFVFMLAHTLWLAAIVAGLAYALLYRATGKLWVPMIAHGVTNGVLGIWVVSTQNWQFW